MAKREGCRRKLSCFFKLTDRVSPRREWNTLNTPVRISVTQPDTNRLLREYRSTMLGLIRMGKRLQQELETKARRIPKVLKDYTTSTKMTHLGCDVMWCGRNLLMFRKQILLPSSRFKSKTTN